MYDCIMCKEHYLLYINCYYVPFALESFKHRVKNKYILQKIYVEYIGHVVFNIEYIGHVLFNIEYIGHHKHIFLCFVRLQISQVTSQHQ